MKGQSRPGRGCAGHGTVSGERWHVVDETEGREIDGSQLRSRVECIGFIGLILRTQRPTPMVRNP